MSSSFGSRFFIVCLFTLNKHCLEIPNQDLAQSLNKHSLWKIHVTTELQHSSSHGENLSLVTASFCLTMLRCWCMSN